MKCVRWHGLLAAIIEAAVVDDGFPFILHHAVVADTAGRQRLQDAVLVPAMENEARIEVGIGGLGRPAVALTVSRNEANRPAGEIGICETFIAIHG